MFETLFIEPMIFLPICGNIKREPTLFLNTSDRNTLPAIFWIIRLCSLFVCVNKAYLLYSSKMIRYTQYQRNLGNGQVNRILGCGVAVPKLLVVALTKLAPI